MPRKIHGSWQWAAHEYLLVGLGLATLFAVVLRVGLTTVLSLELFAVTLAYASFVYLAAARPKVGWQRVRLVVLYAFILWFYEIVARVVPALRLPVHDARLRQADEFLFGVTPAAWWPNWRPWWVTEVMSAGYVTYHLYLHIAIIHGLVGDALFRRRLARHVGTAFAVGLSGYLLVPAMGPARAFPELFASDLAGGPITTCVQWLVHTGSSIYDVFPSLHVLVTASLLDFDWRACRRRFWLMLSPAVVIVLSTVYLRYHYAVDLLAAAVVFVALRYVYDQWWKNDRID